MTNTEKRKALYRELEAIAKAHKTRVEAIYAIEDEEEHQKELEQERANYAVTYEPLYMEWFYLQFPARRGWFSNVFIAGFGACENRRLSLKQTEVVRSYVCASADSWQTQEYYCRTEKGAKVKLTLPRYGNGIGFLTVLP